MHEQELEFRDQIKRLDDAIRDRLGGEARQAELKQRKQIAEALLEQVLKDEKANRDKWSQNNCGQETSAFANPGIAAFTLADRGVDQTG